MEISVIDVVVVDVSVVSDEAESSVEEESRASDVVVAMEETGSEMIDDEYDVKDSTAELSSVVVETAVEAEVVS